MAESDLPPLVRAMLKRASYPHPTGRIKLIQTHISYVFLAGDYVYKVKKPVDFGFLNYSTLGRRRYYCRREVELNRRLCSDTYLGVVPIRETRGGIEVNGKHGRIVEYAVWMRRLPQERMLDELIVRGQATTHMVERVADVLVPFHETTDRSPAISRYGDWAIRYNHRENVEQWTPYVGRTLSQLEHRVLVAFGEAFFARKRDVLARRVQRERIVRTHADLRSDAIFIEDGVCILDCVEFNRRISLLDVARDVGFLEMDLLYRGRPDLAKAFVRRYQDLSQDADLPEVLPFYAYYSACVRGKVENFLLDVPEIPEKERRAAAARAKRYFTLAVEYAKSLPPAMLVITCGLSATGKTTVAEALAPFLDAVTISSDITRKRLAGLPLEQSATAEYGSGIYSPAMSERTYSAMFDEARDLLLQGRSVVIDATFMRRDDRKLAARLARETGAQFACALVVADDRAIQRRMALREAGAAGPSDARWDTYVRQKRRFQRPTEIAEERMMRFDTTKPMKGQISAGVNRLRAVSPLSLRR